MSRWRVSTDGKVPKPEFDAAVHRAMKRIVLQVAEREAKENATGRGGGPKVRSDRLRASIRGFVYADGKRGKIYTRVKYARALEFGATINRPAIVPRKKKALAFTVGGKNIVVRRVRAVTIRIPPHPYMRPAVETALQQAPAIMREELLKEVR